MKLYKAKLHTGGKTREQIIKMFEIGPAPTEEEIKDTTEFYNRLEGAVAYVADGLMNSDYSLIGWPDEENKRMKEAIYLAEQDPMFGCYINSREEFDKDWDAGEYEPFGVLTFDKSEVEIVEEIKTEENTQVIT